MPIPLAGALWTWLIVAIPALVWKIFGVLGIGIIAYTGIDLALDQLENFIVTEFGGFPSNAITILQMTGVDVAIQMIFATYTAVLVVGAAKKVFTIK